MPKRSYFPPALCDVCKTRPQVGQTLWHSGSAWLCPSCLVEAMPGRDTTSKRGEKTFQATRSASLSRRAKAAGDIKEAAAHERQQCWHAHAAESIKDVGEECEKNAEIVNGEAVVPESSQWIKDTLSDPDMIALDASVTRGDLLLNNDILALGLDVSNTIGAANTLDKIIAHEIALAHKVAFEQANWASTERSPEMQMKRLNISARMMTVAQQGALALHKLKTGGTQTLVVQHVHVGHGGQAIVGNVLSQDQDEG